ncbi:hypothetical protein T484DRAFT_1814880 [Baffinella frigidus]|nr:hypothetical protein T484DRAFT_1814880 [Cryptophyta sp. CCMP2293]
MPPLAPSPRRCAALALAVVVALASARPLGGEELGQQANAMPRQPPGRRWFRGCSLRLAGGGEPKKEKRRKSEAAGVGRDPAGVKKTRGRGPGQSKKGHAHDEGKEDDSSAELDDLSDGFFEKPGKGGKGGLSSRAKKPRDLAAKSDQAQGSSKPGPAEKKGLPAGKGKGRGDEGDAASGESGGDSGSSDAMEVNLGEDADAAAEGEGGGEKEERKYSLDERLMAKLRAKQFRVPRHLPPHPP